MAKSTFEPCEKRFSCVRSRISRNSNKARSDHTESNKRSSHLDSLFTLLAAPRPRQRQETRAGFLTGAGVGGDAMPSSEGGRWRRLASLGRTIGFLVSGETCGCQGKGKQAID